MATRVFDGIKFCEQFLEDLPRNMLAKFGQNWPSGLEEEMFKEIVDNARQTLDHPKTPLEQVVLRLSQKNES